MSLNKITFELIEEIFLKLFKLPLNKRKVVIFAVDEKDNVLKNFEETFQFDKLFKKEIKNFINN